MNADDTASDIFFSQDDRDDASRPKINNELSPSTPCFVSSCLLLVLRVDLSSRACSTGPPTQERPVMWTS